MKNQIFARNSKCSKVILALSTLQQGLQGFTQIFQVYNQHLIMTRLVNLEFLDSDSPSPAMQHNKLAFHTVM